MPHEYKILSLFKKNILLKFLYYILMEKIMEKYISEKIAPHIKGDGGWVEFVSLKDDVLTLSFRIRFIQIPTSDPQEMWHL